MNRIQELHELGQSLWYDNIERRLLQNGDLAGMIARGEIRGVTSNPSIFNNAIGKSHDYDEAMETMARSGISAEDIFYALAIEDIQAAADLFRPLYDQTRGGDGFVSLEVSPFLATDTVATATEAQRLWKKVDRPNLMVKIPATQEGIEAIQQSIAAGINVNVTLIFSLERYVAVMDAYLRGLEERVSKGLPVENIASVASFFVSRMDTKVDALLQKKIDAGQQVEQAKAMLGKSAIDNARLAYQEFLNVFSGPRFAALKQHGARLQRPLWASTSTKNPAYRDVLYVEELIGPDTVDTVPPKTLEAFKDHGQARITIQDELDEARQSFDKLARLGIDVDIVTCELEVEGVQAFADAFKELLQTVEERRQKVAAKQA